MISSLSSEAFVAKKLAWLRLSRSSNLGPTRFWQLLKFHGSAEKIIEELEHSSQQQPKPFILCSKGKAWQEIEQHEHQGIQLIAAFEAEFPLLLKHIPDCPPLLSVRGNPQLLNKEMIGVVGARNAALSSCRFSQKLAYDLGQEGWIIVSGLARGIDKHAHQGALQSGTVAVVAGGVDNIYPSEHGTLYQQICQKGVIISEAPLSSLPLASHFPRRNRLISGLRRGVVVIEAAVKSGSLITAYCALEQNREVFSVPGSPLDPRCQGSNDLLRQGAILTESATDILAVLGSQSTNPLPKKKVETSPWPDSLVSLSKWQQQILEALSIHPLAMEDLLSRYPQAAIKDILATVCELELLGKIQRQADNTISLCPVLE